MKNLPFAIYYLPFYSSISKYLNQKINWKIENSRKSKIQAGQSLFEVVVAIAISALVIGGIVSLATNSVRNSTFSKNQSLAANFSQQATEWLRGQRDMSIDVFISKTIPGGVSSTWCLPSLSWDSESFHRNCSETDVGDRISGTPFVRSATFTPVSATSSPSGNSVTTIEADVTVSWSDSQGMHEVTSATTFADWRQR